MKVKVAIFETDILEQRARARIPITDDMAAEPENEMLEYLRPVARQGFRRMSDAFDWDQDIAYLGIDTAELDIEDL